jgi:hypothetical protein
MRASAPYIGDVLECDSKIDGFVQEYFKSRYSITLGSSVVVILLEETLFQ